MVEYFLEVAEVGARRRRLLSSFDPADEEVFEEPLPFRLLALLFLLLLFLSSSSASRRGLSFLARPRICDGLSHSFLIWRLLKLSTASEAASLSRRSMLGLKLTVLTALGGGCSRVYLRH